MRIKSGVKWTYVSSGLLDVYSDAEGEVDMVVSYSAHTKKLEYIQVDPVSGEYKYMFVKEKENVSFVGLNNNVLVGIDNKLYIIDELGNNETLATDDMSLVDACCGLLVRYDGFIASRGFESIVYLNRPLGSHKAMYTYPLPVICISKINNDDIQEEFDLLLKFHIGALELLTYKLKNKSLSCSFVFNFSMNKKQEIIFDNVRTIFLCKEKIRDDVVELPFIRMGENVIAINNEHLLNLDIDQDDSVNALVDKYILHVERLIYVHKHKNYSRKLKVIRIKDYAINEDKIEIDMSDGHTLIATPTSVEVVGNVEKMFDNVSFSKAMLN